MGGARVREDYEVEQLPVGGRGGRHGEVEGEAQVLGRWSSLWIAEPIDRLGAPQSDRGDG